MYIRLQVWVFISWRMGCCNHHGIPIYVGASTTRKYINIITYVLFDEQKLSARYNSTPRGDRLQHIIDRFQFICDVPNVVGAIDGTHNPLVEKIKSS